MTRKATIQFEQKPYNNDTTTKANASTGDYMYYTHVRAFCEGRD